MPYGCNCPLPQPALPDNYIKIFRGDDTNFNNSQWLKILLVTDIDLTGFKGVFNLLGFSYTGAINAEEKSLEIEIPSSATSTFPIGPAQGVFRLEDTENRFKTVSNTIPFYITNEIFNQQEQNIILPVPPDYPITLTLKIGGQATAGNTDYNKLDNIPTFNGTPWKGDITFQGANIAPLSGLTALEDVVDEKASAVDVQNGLNGLQTQITTNKNDIGGLGDQVSEIEAKIPENASAENPLATISDITSTPTELPTASETQAGIVRLANLNETLQNSATNLAVNPKNLFEKLTGYPTREEMNTAIANAAGGDVDLTGYYNEDNLVAGNNITITSEPTGKRQINAIIPEVDLSEYAKTANLATVATSGSYNDLSDKPTIPDTSNLATKTELDRYLPKTGGTMTGNIEIASTGIAPALTVNKRAEFSGGVWIKNASDPYKYSNLTTTVFNGYPILNIGADLKVSTNITNETNKSVLWETEKGAANGIAPLNASGKIDSQYLPEQTARTIESLEEKLALLMARVEALENK